MLRDVAEKGVLVSGDDWLDPVEVVDVVVGGGPDQLNSALSSSSARRLLVESTMNETHKYTFNHQINRNEINIFIVSRRDKICRVNERSSAN